ncbi:MAG: ABC transporter ATP-binding protein [bacterium]|nr:ABC transporter ATP-binding protein [bacterium]
MSDIILTDKICKDYSLGTHTVHALVDVTLRVSKSEFLCIVGPSGSGKTTLLNMIGCLDVPTSGKVTMFGGYDTSQLDDRQTTLLRRDRIGFIFQSFNLLPVLNVLENVGLPLELQRVPRPEIEARVAALVEEVGLIEFARHRPDELSGGQRQRVAVARALITNPQLVLADEPTANLDHDTGMAVLELMLEMNRAHGTTFIFSTHDPKVMGIAKRIVTVEDGRIKEDRNVA